MFGAYGQIGRRRLLAALALLVLVAVGAVSLRLKETSSQTHLAPKASQGNAMLRGEAHGSERSSPDLSDDPSAEGDALRALDEYWRQRLTYPTGRYDPSWLFEAAAQDRQVPVGVPAGSVTYNHTNSSSPLSLDPNRWTPLGPQPEQQPFGGNVSGRVGSIAVDPVTPNIAYIGVSGGGIWKSTNCCTSTTTWAPVTDDPLIG